MKGVPSSPVQCIGPSCTRRPRAVNKLGKRINIRGVEVDEIYNCPGHGDYVDRLAREGGVDFSRSFDSEELIKLQNEALESGTLRGVSLPTTEKKRIGRWLLGPHHRHPESRHGSSLEKE